MTGSGVKNGVVYAKPHLLVPLDGGVGSNLIPESLIAQGVNPKICSTAAVPGSVTDRAYGILFHARDPRGGFYAHQQWASVFHKSPSTLCPKVA